MAMLLGFPKKVLVIRTRITGEGRDQRRIGPERRRAPSRPSLAQDTGFIKVQLTICCGVSILNDTLCKEETTRAVSYNVRSDAVYRTAQAAKRLGVSRQTLLRWLHEGRVNDVSKDHRGWRVFFDEDIRRIRQQIEGGNR